MQLKRHKQNPILKPIKNNTWESGAVFNCGAIYSGGLVHLLYRAIGEYDYYISTLGHAISKDGINFKREKKPVFKPRQRYEKWGCEDPRITKIGNKFYITYVALCKPAKKGGGPPQTAMACTKDFVHFERHGLLIPRVLDNRDVVLFPEKIGGKYIMLHRPHNWTKKCVCKKQGKLYLKKKEKISKWWPFAKKISESKEKWITWPIKEKPNYFPEKPSIWIAYSNNLKDWFGHQVIMEPKEYWENVKIGAGSPPIKTDKGWLLIYHGVGEDKNKILKYCAGAALLDLKNPSVVIARTKKPILEPQKDYEIFGDVPNVVFPEGAIVKKDELFVYYGAADKTCCLATCKLKKLLNFLLKTK